MCHHTGHPRTAAGIAAACTPTCGPSWPGRPGHSAAEGQPALQLRLLRLSAVLHKQPWAWCLHDASQVRGGGGPAGAVVIVGQRVLRVLWRQAWYQARLQAGDTASDALMLQCINKTTVAQS